MQERQPNASSGKPGLVVEAGGTGWRAAGSEAAERREAEFAEKLRTASLGDNFEFLDLRKAWEDY